MSDTPKGAYWIAHVTVTDPEAYARYAAIATDAIAEFGGTFLSRSGRYKQLEGAERARNVVAWFPSLEAAEACYFSETYQRGLDHARGAAERDLVIVEAT